MQFVITALDHAAAETRGRRSEVRPAHLDRVRALDVGSVLSAGAILDEDGAPIGSSMHVEFPDRGALDAWLADDPYVVAGVWDTIEIRPFRQARFS